VYRVRLRLLGLRFKERAPAEVSRENRLRVDALGTVATGLAMINTVLAACMQARHLFEALRHGDRLQVMRATSLEASYLAAEGGPVSQRERDLDAISRRLVEQDGGPRDRAHYEGTRGAGQFWRGLWTEAHESFKKCESLSASGAGMHLLQMYLASTEYYLGNQREAEKLQTRLLTVAHDRGDLQTTVAMRTGSRIAMLLATDEPDRARRELREALAEWSHKQFFNQHWQAMIYEPAIDLYIGDTQSAYERFVRDMPALRRSWLLRTGYVRAITLSTHGRLAIASIDARPDLRRKRIAEATRSLHALEREWSPWVGVLAAGVRSAIAGARGDADLAIEALRDQIRRAHDTRSLSYVPPAQHRLGELVGGDEGRELVKSALETLVAWGVRKPARWLAPQQYGQPPISSMRRRTRPMKPGAARLP
jgi:hypothetical protein